MTDSFVAASSARSLVHGCGRAARALALSTLLAVAWSAPTAVNAQENAPLVRLLHDARDFRVRVRAAFVLGNGGAPQSAASLEQALLDPHPAVRAAAATALGRVGTLESIPALRRAERDPESVVRSQAASSVAQIQAVHVQPVVAARATAVRSTGVAPGPVSFEGKRYVVVVGNMANRSEHQDSTAVNVLSNEVLNALRESPDVVAFAGNGEITAADARQIRERALPVLRIEGNLVRVTQRDGASEVSVRCEVSLMIMDDQQRSVRGAVSGAASRAEQPSSRRDEQQKRLVEQALIRAVRSALTNVGQAFAAAAAYGASSSASDAESEPRSTRGARARRKRS